MTRDPLPPVLLSEVRSLGFPVILTCPVCVHTRVVQLLAFAGLPDALTVEDLGIPFDALGAGGRVARALTLTTGSGSRISARRGSGTGCRTGRHSCQKRTTRRC